MNTQDFNNRFQRWKNGERYWDIRGIDLPKYDTGNKRTVITDDGSVFNVDPSAIGARNLEVTTPDIEVVGNKPQWMINRDELIGQVVTRQDALRETNMKPSSVDNFVDKYKYGQFNPILSGLANFVDDWKRDRSPIRALFRHFGFSNPIISSTTALLDNELNTQSNTPKLIVPEMIMDFGNKYGAAIRGFNHLISEDGFKKTARYYNVLHNSNPVTDRNYAGKFWDTAASGIGDIFDLSFAGNGVRFGYKDISQIYNNVHDYSAAKQFIQRYEYPYKIKPSIIFDNQKLDKLYNRLIHQHNTFARGVDPYEAIAFGRFPAGTNPEDAARYSLTHIPKATMNNTGGLVGEENALYTSNSLGLAQAYTNGNGYIGIVQRPIKPMSMFNTRRKALYENDFQFQPIPGNILSSTTDFPKSFKYAHKTSHRSKNAYRYGVSYYAPNYPRINNGSVVRANAGAFPIPNTNRTDKDFRHYLFVGNEGDQPVDLLYMYPWKGDAKMSDYNYTSVGFSHKK